MDTYEVPLVLLQKGTMVIDADSKEEAIKLASELVIDGGLTDIATIEIQSVGEATLLSLDRDF